ncbi:MAG: SUMF1/EgtB/PvdO family nonheme iron enzyme [Planctomycetota bacterium]
MLPFAHPLHFCLVTLCLSWSSLCIASPQPDSNEQPIQLAPKPRWVNVEITNPQKHSFDLWYVGPGPAEKLGNYQSDNLNLQLAEGKYLARDLTSKFSMPIPAIASAVGKTTLRVEVGAAAKVDNGYVRIPAGPALIGDEIGVGAGDERLSIQYLRDYWIGKYEVTNGQYVEFLNDVKRCDADWLDLGSRKCRIKKLTEETFSTDEEKQPVVMISLAGAQAYCQWMTEKTGQKHRLPTEVEWEKAARGPNSSVYAYGDRYIEGLANQESGSIGDVGKFRPSPWGLYDMTGNVFEWMSNRYDAKQPDKVMNQSLRGGSYVLDGMYLRNSFRMRQSPSVMTDDIGFRVLREVNQDESE